MFLLFRPEPDLFLKASLPPGARWITVRPNGPGTEGHPVLIQPAADGAYRVIGGAGGKLNYLKLTGVRDEASYKEEARQHAATYREERKRQQQRDREAGLDKSKARARESLKAAVGDRQAQFVQTVATALGWTDEQMRFPEEKYSNVSESARKKAEAQHARDLLNRAREAVDQTRQRLLQDAEARAAAGLGEVPLTTEKPDQISVQDLDPVDPATKGLGFSADYGKRAEQAGLTPEQLAQEAQASKPPLEPAQAMRAEARKATAEKIADELKAIRDPGPAVDPRAVADAKQALALLKAEKELRAAEREAREKGKQIDTATAPIEPKAYILETGGPVDSDVVKDLENDLRTLKTRAFLESVGREMGGNTEALGKHIGVGAYNSVNALALATVGASLVDRSVVDVLGVAGASQVLARRLQTDLTPEEMANVREAMGRFHVDHYMKLSDAALREAREWHEMAHEIELGEAANGADLAVAQELNGKRREFAGNAQRVLGTALGEMEANAALVLALEQPPKKQVQVSLGRTSVEQAITQARALGLDRGDYQVERAGASTMLTVTEAGMDKLAAPVARDDLTRLRGSLDIIQGMRDEADWLPQGVARRPDLAMNVKPGVAPRLAKPFPQAPADVGGAIRDYIGGRMADGDAPAEIVEGLLSEGVLQKAGDRAAFMQELEKIAPLYGADGKMVRAEAYQGAFEKLADDYVGRIYGAERTPLHRQDFPVDDVATEALHRALAAHPDAVAAFKPVGELTPQGQHALRKAFLREYGRKDPAAEAMRGELEKLDGQEPEREVEDMFGRGVNPEWREWKTQRDQLAERVNAASMNWGKYLAVMGSPARAYAAMQDVVKSGMLRDFARAHNTLRPEQPLKIGKSVIANDLDHLDALDPAARDRRLADRRQLIDSLRARVAGRYAAGGVADKMEAARAAEEAASQAQMGLFGDELPADVAAEDQTERSVELGERFTLGHAAERQIAGMMDVVGKNFRPGEAINLWHPTMSGKYIARQRAVKLIEHNKRTMLGMGVGSGKTSIMLSGFTDLHAQGKAHKGLFLVPSIVQGQFHGEALRLLEPGKYNWHADPGANREQRIKAYRDPATHFSVVTHQAFRDDMLHLVAKRDGTTPKAVADRLRAMTPEQRRDTIRELMQAEGINADYLAVDEGHNLLNRAGKQNSEMADVIDAVSASTPYYVSATADPVKNDASEAFDVLAKMEPERYRDRDAFMRRYGVDTASARDGLQREMARYFYTGSVDPGVKAERKEIKVKLGDDDLAQVKALDEAAAKMRVARMQGGVDVEAARALSPGSFEGVDPAQHEAVARDLQKSVGIAHSAAVQHAISGKAKLDALAQLAGERKGRPGVVFAHSLDRVREIGERLTGEGHRVVTLTGGDSSAEKDRKRREFTDGQHDIIVCSDAGAVGANLQRGKWLAQFDTPVTAMTHAQRQGRIHRIGQTEDVELLDLLADHAAERRARDRLSKKYDLRSIMTSPLDGLDDTGIAGYLQRVRAGDAEAATPAYLPAGPGDAPEGLAPPDEQQSLF